jgi:hypothetical protein
MFNNFFPENRAVCKIMWKSMVEPDRTQMTLFCIVLCIVCVQMCTVLLPPCDNPIAFNKYITYGACALHARQLRLQTHTQKVQYLLHGNNGCFSPHCYVTRILPVLFILCDITKEIVDEF